MSQTHFNIVCLEDPSDDRVYGDRSEPSIRLSTHAQCGNIYLKIPAIEKSIGKPLSDISLDLLEVAVFVYMADRAIRRSSRTWVRDYTFYLPVRKLDRWKAVEETLVETLQFLAGDNISIQFRARTDESQSVSRPLVKSEPPQVDSICLFSGGLDSFIGAASAIVEGKIPLLVSHYGGGLRGLQRRLSKAMASKSGAGDIPHLQVRVGPINDRCTKVRFRTKENSLRTRSFLYLSLASIAAYELGVPDILVFENGILSWNLPLDRAREGSRSTRTTHPRFLNLFGELVDSLLGRSLSIQLPFLFTTKKEMVQGFLENPLRDQMSKTVSCWGYPRRTIYLAKKTKKRANHCGYCVPCLLRRFSMHGAEAASYDDEYHVDVLANFADLDIPRRIDLVSLARFCREITAASPDEILLSYPELLVDTARPIWPKKISDPTDQSVQLYKRFAEQTLAILDQASSSELRDVLLGQTT